MWVILSRKDKYSLDGNMGHLICMPDNGIDWMHVTTDSPTALATTPHFDMGAA
jgi:hypothetical protein